MRVALLPTGRTEWHGLPVALQRLFPAHELYVLPGAAVFRSTGPFDGFTTSTLTEKHEHEDEYLPESATDLVGRAAQEALGDGPHRGAADAVLVLDDLELANRHQPARVARVFRRAVEYHLAGLQGARERTARTLRERVSFHLVVPMIEAWFFGDRQALRVAGVPDDLEPILDGAGLEDFRTLDVRYEGAREVDCPIWIAKGRKKADRPKWLGAQRERHPKGYLQWLCRDGAAKNCTSYDESHRGAEALKQLDWAAVLGSRSVGYLGALVEDLADVLREPLPLPMHGDDGPPPVTSWSRRPQSHVLRNL